MLMQGEVKVINSWTVQSLSDGSGKSLSVSQGRTVIHLDYETLEPPARQPTRREQKAANGKSIPLIPLEETRDPVEIDLLGQVNARAGGYYKHINHLLNAAKRHNPDIDPDNLADPSNVEAIIAAAIEHASVPPQLDASAPTGEQESLFEAPAPRYE